MEEKKMIAMDSPPGFGHTSQPLALLKDLATNLSEDSLALMPALLSFLKHHDHLLVRQSIATGTTLLHNIALELDKYGKADWWLQQMWDSMLHFKDAMYHILTLELQTGSVGIKILAVKFLEAYLLLFTSDASNMKRPCTEEKGRLLSMPWFAEGNSLFNPSLFASEANRTLASFFDMLQSASSHHGSLTIVVINCLTAIARSCPVHYNRILSKLLDCDSNLGTLERGHAASVRFSLRTALLTFLKCTHPIIIESRDELLKALRSMNPGEATEQVIRRVEKVPKCAGQSCPDTRLIKDNNIPFDEDVRKKHVTSVKKCSSLADGIVDQRTGFIINATSTSHDEPDTEFGQEILFSGFSLSSLEVGGKAIEVEKMMSRIGSLMAEGERATKSLDILISNINADLLADIVIDNMKHLPKNPSTLISRHKDLEIDLHGSTSLSKKYAFSAGSMTPNNPVDIRSDGRSCNARVSTRLTR